MQLTRRLDANHDMTFGQGLNNFAVDAEATAQNVRTRLMMLMGEWFLDIDAGIPYLQNVTEKPIDLQFAESVIKQTILETDGVESIDLFSLDFNSNTRQLTISTTVSTVFGSTKNIQVRQ